MNELANYLLCRQTFAAGALMESHPPKIKNANKKIVFDLAAPPQAHHGGSLNFSRWRIFPLPTTVSAFPTQITVREDYFGYEPPQDDSAVEWYLNFADSDLFFAYGGPLFAQDEIQVAEHPALGALREALLAAKIEPLTVENGQSTPILIRGVERRCSIATDCNPAAGRPEGLYGNRFSKASAEAIFAATTPLEPPTFTNLIAIAAPFGGYGHYRLDDIQDILATALTGFSAARVESQLSSVEEPRVIIHTGFWGCGAYGGNRVLMALLQLLAANFSRIERLVFHTGSSAGTASFLQAREILERELLRENCDRALAEVLHEIEAKGFEWGVSDGN